MKPIRVTKKQACEILAISNEALRKLMQTDPNFPKPYKVGASRQSRVFFDYDKLVEWHKQKLGT